MNTKLTEKKLELAIIKLLKVEGYKHILIQTIARKTNKVLSAK